MSLLVSEINLKCDVPKVATVRGYDLSLEMAAPSMDDANKSALATNPTSRRTRQIE